MTRRTAGTNYRGFTLIELLVVIGIIVILIGLLLPVISKIRKAAYIADTQNEITQISNACNQYYQDFHSYPGPMSNDAIENSQSTTPTPISLELYNSATAQYSTAKTLAMTGTENLVLGLLGGLNIDQKNSTATSTVIGFNPAEVGLGPFNLSPLNPHRFSAYLQASSGSTNLLSNFTGLPFADSNGTSANDSFIPEFVDRFPSPLPLLYMRARTGARGVVSGSTPPLANPLTSVSYPAVTAITDPISGQTAHYQYDLGEIVGYTNSYIGSPNTPGNTVAAHGLRRIGTVSANPTLSPEPIANDAFAVLMNTQIAPSDASTQQLIDATSKPKAVDQFIIISAGPDGIYGTQDDVTSFGSISQQ